jgi:hypothetical protein
MTHAARFQAFEVLNRSIEQLPVVVGHRFMVTTAANQKKFFARGASPFPP